MVDLSLLLQNREFPLIMGILNATPDSFSNQGATANLAQALKMIDDGAAIIDIGGESTRPGAKEVDAREEINRVLPLVKEIKKARPEVVLSVDTRKSTVARAVLDEGVEIINDVSNLGYSPDMAEVVASFGGGLILMHSRGTPENMAEFCVYDDVISEVKSELAATMEKALACGVKKENIWLDPGLGFAKNAEQNFQLLSGIESLKELAPVVIGHSRKRFIRDLLGVGIENADFGTAAISIYAMQHGADVLRVHDVKNNYDVLKMYTRCSSNG